jgi:hypothetical protein
MSAEAGGKVISKGGSYVVEGASLKCSLGGTSSQLKVTTGHGVDIKGKKQANIGDHVGGKNIETFGTCSRASPPPPCIMATAMEWVGGKETVFIGGKQALLNTSINMCMCGGIIIITNDGQS